MFKVDVMYVQIMYTMKKKKSLQFNKCIEYDKKIKKKNK